MKGKCDFCGYETDVEETESHQDICTLCRTLRLLPVAHDREAYQTNLILDRLVAIEEKVGKLDKMINEGMVEWTGNPPAPE